MSARRNLLLGILALQNNFITRAQLLAAFNAWVEDKGQSLGALLLAQQALRAEQLALLDASSPSTCASTAATPTAAWPP